MDIVREQEMTLDFRKSMDHGNLMLNSDSKDVFGMTSTVVDTAVS